MGDVKCETPEAVRTALRRVFTDQAVGVEQALKLGQLAARLPGVGNRTIRKAVAELIKVYGLPIVSDNHAGYYRAADTDELRRGADDCKRRAMALLVRRKRLLDQGQHELGGQMELMRDAARNEAAMAMLEE